MPEPYWLVDATLRGRPASASTAGRYHAGAQPRLKTAEEADGDRRGRPCAASGDDHQAREDDAQGARAAALRPHLAAARGEHPLRLLRAAHAGRRPALLRGAQGPHVSADELALPDHRHGRRDQADRRARRRRNREYADGARRTSWASTCCRWRASSTTTKVGDHHAIIPTNSPQHASTSSPTTTAGSTTSSPAGSSPSSTPRRSSRTRASRRRSRSTSSARAAGSSSCPAGAASTASRPRRAATATDDEDDEGGTQQLPRLEHGETVDTRDGRGRWRRRPSRRGATRDASLLGAMEAAGKDLDDEELREAMKDSGIGTPATRAAIIERLIDVGYVERDARALVATEKGLNVIRLLGEHALTSPGADRRVGAAALAHRARRGLAPEVHGRHREVRRGDGAASSTPSSRTSASRGPTSARAPCAATTSSREPQGLLLLVARGPGLRLRHLEEQGGQDAAGRGRARAHRDGPHRAPVTGFKGRSGRSFRARLALQQGEDGKWRVEFDEPWAREGAKPPEAEAEEATPAAAPADGDVRAA